MLLSAIATLEKRALSDAIVLPFWKSTRAEPAAEIGSLLSKIEVPLDLGDCTGKDEELIWVYGDEVEAGRIILLGLGEKEEVTHEKLQRAYGALAMRCRERKIKSLAIVLPDCPFFSPKETAFFAASGLFTANYSFDELRHDTLKSSPTCLLEKIEWITEEPTLALQSIKKAQMITHGVNFARDLNNGNADDITPQAIGKAAKRLQSEYPVVETKIYDEQWIREQGMGLFLAVARGSTHAPQFIVVKYQGNPDSSDHTVLIGKGLTFDTGGLNIKTGTLMNTMKGDMSAAGAVLGVIKALGELSLPVNVTAVIATCENAIGPAAFKPGDVYKAASGKTVEIGDTDAEGRLTLADALHYAVKELHPSRIIDMATLTGSVVRALGREIAGLWSNSDSLARELEKAGERTHEKVWKMPLFAEYKSNLRSDIADIKNVGSTDAGACVAALFLQEFVQSVPWAHIDIAGTARQLEAKSYRPKFATGYGVRLLVDYLEHLATK